jgi:uncharacterized protein (DUF1697 family)
MTFIALLRAINVGGHATVTMSDLKRNFTAAGCRKVRTYIQSGNVVFESPGSVTKILPVIRGKLRPLLGKEPLVFVRTASELDALVRSNPFAPFDTDPTLKLYVAFLERKPRGRLQLPLIHAKEALDIVAVKGRDALVVSRRKPNGLYGFPNNVVEEVLGVSATTRNWNTVRKLAAFVRT